MFVVNCRQIQGRSVPEGDLKIQEYTKEKNKGVGISHPRRSTSIMEVRWESQEKKWNNHKGIDRLVENLIQETISLTTRKTEE